MSGKAVSSLNVTWCSGMGGVYVCAVRRKWEITFHVLIFLPTCWITLVWMLCLFVSVFYWQVFQKWNVTIVLFACESGLQINLLCYVFWVRDIWKQVNYTAEFVTVVRLILLPFKLIIYYVSLRWSSLLSSSSTLIIKLFFIYFNMSVCLAYAHKHSSDIYEFCVL